VIGTMLAAANNALFSFAKADLRCARVFKETRGEPE
jgi:hypothetical protein